MENTLWLDGIKRSTDLYSSFLEWLKEETEKVRDQYKLAKSWEDVLRLQGEEKRLDTIKRLAIMRDREARQQAAYENQVGRS